MAACLGKVFWSTSRSTGSLLHLRPSDRSRTPLPFGVDKRSGSTDSKRTAFPVLPSNPESATECLEAAVAYSCGGWGRPSLIPARFSRDRLRGGPSMCPASSSGLRDLPSLLALRGASWVFSLTPRTGRLVQSLSRDSSS